MIASGFIGYLITGVLGAVAAAFAVFATSLLFVLIGVPHYRRFAYVPQVEAFVQGVTTAPSPRSLERHTSSRADHL